MLTVTPRRRGPDIRLELLGGSREHGKFSFTWPIWRAPISLAAARALIGHGGLDDEATRAAIGVTGRQRAPDFIRRFMNFMRAETIDQTLIPPWFNPRSGRRARLKVLPRAYRAVSGAPGPPPPPAFARPKGRR